jgi:hypothetical protein
MWAKDMVNIIGEHKRGGTSKVKTRDGKIVGEYKIWETS